MSEQRQREVLLEGHAALQRTSESLMRSERAALEAEAVGSHVASELETQREVLQRASNRLTDVSTLVSRSRQILNLMSRRICLNKLLLILIILMEVAILCALIYHKFMQH